MYISHFPFYKLLQFYAFVHCFEVNTYICLILSYLNDYLYDFSTINLILCAGNHLYDYGQVISKTYNICSLFCCYTIVITLFIPRLFSVVY